MSNTIDTMIDPNDSVLLLIDHQSGLFQLVRDIELPVLRSNATPMRGMCRAEKTLQE
jgi:nicotinamidase-related amidase